MHRPASPTLYRGHRADAPRRRAGRTCSIGTTRTAADHGNGAPLHRTARVRNPTDVTGLRITLQVLLVLTSLLLVPLVLLHKGKGGGLSDMFGGGITAGAGSSGVAERNLNRITVIVALLWTVMIILLGLIEKFSE